MPKALLMAALFYSAGGVWASGEQGLLNRDLMVGASHNVRLKSHLVVQILKHSDGTLVIMAVSPDGSSGVYQVDAAAVDLLAPTNIPAPSSSPTLATNAAPVASPPPAPPPPPVTLEKPAAPAPPSGPPTYPADFVGNPELETTAGQKSAGTASIVKLKDGFQSYIVSARHLLGPAGGFDNQTAAADVPAFVQSIAIESFSGGRHRYNVTGLLVPTQRLQAYGGDPIDDMAIYSNHDSSPQDQAVALAETLPAVGDPVWLIAHVRGGVPEGQVLQSGKVTNTDRWIAFQFDNDAIQPAGASGAPLLNARGEVLGVYSGHSVENGHIIGFAIPSPLIIKTIKEAPASNR